MKLGHTHAINFVGFSALSSSSASRFNHFTITTNYIKLKPYSVIRTLLKVKTFQPSLSRRAFNFQIQTPLTATANYLRNFRFSGIGSIFVVSVASASTITHAMDAGDSLVDDPRKDSPDLAEDEENVHHLWKRARKFWLPVFFFLTVLTNLADPFTILFIKLTLFLLSTKPNPFSVYIFVDQLCQESARQDTRFLKVMMKTQLVSSLE